MPFFHYRALEELREDIARRGVSVRLAEGTSHLARPVEIAGRTVGNRLAVHPMEGCDGNLDGTPGPLTFRRWRRFAEGGASLLWGEATAVVPEARANTRQLLISPETAPAMRLLLDETRAARRNRFGVDSDFFVGMQLTHSGRWSHAAPLVVQRAAALEAVRGTDSRLLSDAELEQLEDRFVVAAGLARDAGFNFVDIKQCHTYLLNELLGSGARAGPYGGEYENRTRFVRNVFEKIRAKLGESIMLATRINVFDGVPYTAGADAGIGAPVSVDRPYRQAWGVDAQDPTQPDLAEPLRLIGELRSRGLALVNVSMGSPYYNPHIGRPFEKAPVGGYVPPEHPLAGVERHIRLTAVIQRAYPDLPVIGSGYSWLRHFALHAAEANVAEGGVTMVGLGRGALAYPDFAVDALERGGMRSERACIGVSYCTALMRAKHNNLGQFETGCVPRDRMYAAVFKQAQAGATRT